MSEPPDQSGSDSPGPESPGPGSRNEDPIGRLYRTEQPEPPAHLDAAIQAAARADAALPARPWRYPVGLGAAASALLAVLVLFPEPEVREAISLSQSDSAPRELLLGAFDSEQPGVPGPPRSQPEATAEALRDETGAKARFDLDQNRTSGFAAPAKAASPASDTPINTPRDAPLDTPTDTAIDRASGVSAGRPTPMEPSAADRSREPRSNVTSVPAVAPVAVASAEFSPPPSAEASGDIVSEGKSEPACAEPAVISGPFASLPEVTRITVCGDSGVRIVAAGGHCQATYIHASARIELREHDGTTHLLIIDDGVSAELICQEGAWVLQPFAAPP